MTKTQVLQMIDRAKEVKVGVLGGPGYPILYFNVPHDEARRKADDIAAFGLVVEFGHESMQDTLYIEAWRM